MSKNNEKRRIFARSMAREMGQVELDKAGGGILGGTPQPQQNGETPEPTGGGGGGGGSFTSATQYVSDPSGPFPLVVDPDGNFQWD